MSIVKVYICRCGKEYLIFIPTEKQAKMQDPKTIKDVDARLKIGYKKELNVAKNFSQKKGLILVDGANLEAFQCSCGRTVDVDVVMQKKIDEEMERATPVVSQPPQAKGDKMENDPLDSQKHSKFTRIQKIAIIITIALIVLVEFSILGIRDYYQGDEVMLKEVIESVILITLIFILGKKMIIKGVKFTIGALFKNKSIIGKLIISLIAIFAFYRCVIKPPVYYRGLNNTNVYDKERSRDKFPIINIYKLTSEMFGVVLLTGLIYLLLIRKND